MCGKALFRFLLAEFLRDLCKTFADRDVLGADRLAFSALDALHGLFFPMSADSKVSWPVQQDDIIPNHRRRPGCNQTVGPGCLIFPRPQGPSRFHILPGMSHHIESIPQALDETELVCSSVNVGTTKAGINMDAVEKMGRIVKETAQRTADRECIGAAKLVVFCNAPEDNPFMAGAFHGPGEPDCVINVGVSGPGVVRAAIKKHGGKQLVREYFLGQSELCSLS